MEVRKITEQHYLDKKRKMERVGKPGVTLEMKIQTKYNYVLGRFLI